MWLARKFKQNLEFTVSQGYFAKKQLDAMLQPKKESIREVLFGR